MGQPNRVGSAELVGENLELLGGVENDSHSGS